MPLNHFTCAGRSELIAADHGLLRAAITLAGPQLSQAFRADSTLVFTSQVVWMTTIEHVTPLNRAAVGLTAELPGACDRTTHRWVVTDDEAEMLPWTIVRERWPRGVVSRLEGLPGVRPDTWWVGRGPIQAQFAPHLIGAGR